MPSRRCSRLCRRWSVSAQKEGHIGGTLTPVAAAPLQTHTAVYLAVRLPLIVASGVQPASVTGEVVVILAVVEREVAGIAEDLRYGLVAIRQVDLFSGKAARALDMGTQTNRVATGNYRRAAGATYRRWRVRSLEHHTFGGKGVYVGGFHQRFAIASVSRILIFDVYPKNVGSFIRYGYLSIDAFREQLQRFAQRCRQSRSSLAPCFRGGWQRLVRGSIQSGSSPPHFTRGASSRSLRSPATSLSR